MAALVLLVGCTSPAPSAEAPPAPALAPAPKTPELPTSPEPALPDEPAPVTSGRLQTLRATAQAKMRARDYAGAAAAYDTACEEGDAAACVALADMLDRGRGVPEDADRARLLYQRGCAAGMQQACDQLGH